MQHANIVSGAQSRGLQTDTRLADLIAGTELFGDVDDADRRELAAMMVPFELAAGAALFRQGDPADRMYLIAAGRAEVAVRTPGDDRATISTAGPGAVVGEMALSRAGNRTATVTALEPLSGYTLATQDFDILRAAYRPAAFRVLRQLSRVLCTRVRALAESIGGDPPPAAEAAASPDGRLVPITPEGVRFLRILPFFAPFTDDELDILVAGMRQWEVPRGRVLFGEGSPGASCFITVRGAVEASIQRGERRHRLAVLGPGRMFGEISLIDHGRRSATCRVRENALLLEISADEFDRLFSAGSRLSFKFLDAVNRNLTAAQSRANAFRGRSDAGATAEAAAAAVAAPAEFQERAVADAAVQSRFEEDRREALIDKIRESVIGDNVVVDGPFGPRRLVFADYTASGRSLTFVEEFIRREVLPLYANTNSESSSCALHTTRLRGEARRIIHRAVNGGDDDVVVFCGSGATDAIDKLIRILELRLPAGLDSRYHLARQIPADERPVVFIGPYEHHANDLPWRETIADLVTIPEDADGRIDLAALEEALRRHARRPLKIGSFSAASNVTGIVSDDRAVAALLHRYGALSFWDYAAAGPYMRIDMNPAGEGSDGDPAHKDAAFIAPHKFIGGPGTPGVLVAKRALFRNRVPSVPGAGSVAFVTPTSQRYLADPVAREEGGTPGIVESIRAGLVFQLKEAVGSDAIRTRENSFARRAIASWRSNPRLWVLGNPELERLSIVSLLARHKDGFLHWNFVVALLNDLFGIQARGGFSGADPYGHNLLGIGQDALAAFDRAVAAGDNGIKPGWFRLNFNYFISEAVFDYIVAAVHLVADEGWKLLPLYQFDPASGLWTHRHRQPAASLRLDDLSYASGTLEYRSGRTTEPEAALAGYLVEARHILRASITMLPDRVVEPEMSADFARLRWFPLPSEALADLRAGAAN